MCKTLYIASYVPTPFPSFIQHSQWHCWWWAAYSLSSSVCFSCVELTLVLPLVYTRVSLCTLLLLLWGGSPLLVGFGGRCYWMRHCSPAVLLKTPFLSVLWLLFWINLVPWAVIVLLQIYGLCWVQKIPDQPVLRMQQGCEHNRPWRCRLQENGWWVDDGQILELGEEVPWRATYSGSSE